MQPQLHSRVITLILRKQLFVNFWSNFLVLETGQQVSIIRLVVVAELFGIALVTYIQYVFFSLQNYYFPIFYSRSTFLFLRYCCG